VTWQLRSKDLKVYKYLPWAQTEVMVPYMIRRAQELNQMKYPLDIQYDLLKHELWCRLSLQWVIESHLLSFEFPLWIEERPTVITLVSQFPAILITISTYTLTSLMSTLPMRHSISVKMTKMSQIWSEAIFHYYVIWVKMMATFTPKWYSIICYQIHYEDQLFNLAPLLSSFATFPPPFLN